MDWNAPQKISRDCLIETTDLRGAQIFLPHGAFRNIFLP
jgi:hypothetical protein